MLPLCSFFFFNDTATTEIYTLSLHDALPISVAPRPGESRMSAAAPVDTPDTMNNAPSHGLSAQMGRFDRRGGAQDRKSTRLNSSHLVISYAVFCLKKKKHAYTLASATVL